VSATPGRVAVAKEWCVVRAAGDPLPLMLDVRAGREIIRQGEPNPDAWVIRTGALLMEMIDVEGHRLALDVLGPGERRGSRARSRGIGSPTG
jgi:hypothetical protein